MSFLCGEYTAIKLNKASKVLQGSGHMRRTALSAMELRVLRPSHLLLLNMTPGLVHVFNLLEAEAA